MRPGRILLALLAPLLLTGCLLSPGKFTSSLRINADRSFTFTYQGEVIQIDPTSRMTAGLDTSDVGTAQTEEERSAQAERKVEIAQASAELEQKRKAIAEALAKEAGYRSVRYVGGGKFLVDYQISGLLTTSFIYPFNLDGEAIFPFVAIEVRKEGTVRVKAPAFGKSNDRPGSAGPLGPMGAPDPSEQAEGSFTLTTDAEIVAHNNEDGAKAAGPGLRSIIWTVNPRSRDVPTAVLRMRD